MWPKTTTNFEAVDLLQVGIGQDRRELQNLVERGVLYGGFSVVEDVRHAANVARMHRCSKFKFRLEETVLNVT